MTENEIRSHIDKVLHSIVHPETGKSLATPGMVGNIAAGDEGISLTIVLERPRDPFAGSLRRQLKDGIERTMPQMKDKVTVNVREGAAAKSPEAAKPASTTGNIGRVIAVASGKGGVGKSSVTANLAVTLARMGLRVGILDADIYGPSQPRMFGVEDYRPVAQSVDGHDEIIPAEVSGGIRLMSIGFFIEPGDALVWRGPMASGALKQMIHQTAWGPLDVLLLDMPPGTGDVHLTVLHEIRVDGAVVVSTPQRVALDDVERGIKMFRAQGLDILVLGIVENMAWFTPAELPDNKYYIFGRDGAARLAERESIPLLGQIPIVQSVMQGAEDGAPAATADSVVGKYYEQIAEKIVDRAG